MVGLPDTSVNIEMEEKNVEDKRRKVRVNRMFFFFSSRRRHTRYWRDWSSDVCSSDLDRWGRTKTTALMMGVSAGCCVLIGLLFGAPAWLVLLVSLIWGFAIVADSAQFSTIVTELSDQAYVGTALTLQLAGGFALTAATIWLIPLVEDIFGWRWAFAFLAVGPALGVLAMVRLRSLPEAGRIAGGRG